MIKVEPIMHFAGQAKQAMDLYSKAFGAKVNAKILFSEANPKDWQCKDEEKDFIYYAEIKIGRQTIMLGDNVDAIKDGITANTGNSFAIDLLVQFDSDDELKTAYDILSDGATITAPLTSQTYCSLTCSLVDKFGGRWQFMSGYKG